MKSYKIKFCGVKFSFLIAFFACLSFAADHLSEMSRKCRNGESKACNEAFSLYKQNCENNDKNSCGNAGLYLLKGIGTNANPQEAIIYLERACDGGVANHCFALAQNYENGTSGMQKDSSKSAELYKKACSLGFAAACRR